MSNKAKKEKTQEELLEEPIFEGGPTLKLVNEWKITYGNTLYRIDFDDNPYIFRTLNRQEYKEVLTESANKEDPAGFHREEVICDNGVVWPQDYSYEEMKSDLAGRPTVVSEYIMTKSGFSSNGGPKKL